MLEQCSSCIMLLAMLLFANNAERNASIMGIGLSVMLPKGKVSQNSLPVAYLLRILDGVQLDARVLPHCYSPRMSHVRHTHNNTTHWSVARYLQTQPGSNQHERFTHT